jgi:NADPH2:quinone reductase
MVRRIVVSRHGEPEVLVPVTEEPPEPGPGEARVAVEAAGVSGFDLIYRRWRRLPGCPPLPFALGEDVVGRVDKLGPDVSTLSVGQRVAAATWALGIGGGYAESICLPAGDLVSAPESVDAAVAVCLVANYLTAHLHLHQYGRVQPGERLLVHGATGGVGSAVLELGRVAELEMYGTASQHNLPIVSQLGAEPINYRSEDFVERIVELTGDGVDIVVDTVGGAKQLMRSYRALRRGGRLVWLGSAATRDKGLSIGLTSLVLTSVLRRFPDGRSVPVTPEVGAHALANPDWYRSTLSMLIDLAAAGTIQPLVSERFPLADAAGAHERLERGGHAGKVVLVTDAYHQVTEG